MMATKEHSVVFTPASGEYISFIYSVDRHGAQWATQGQLFLPVVKKKLRFFIILLVLMS